MAVKSSLKKGPKIGVQEVFIKMFNSVINFRRVKHFWLCLLETKVELNAPYNSHMRMVDQLTKILKKKKIQDIGETNSLDRCR